MWLTSFKSCPLKRARDSLILTFGGWLHPTISLQGKVEHCTHLRFRALNISLTSYIFVGLDITSHSVLVCHACTTYYSAARTSLRLRDVTYVPKGTQPLVEAWKCSQLYAAMIAEIDGYDHALAGYNPLMCNSASSNLLTAELSSDDEGKNNEFKMQVAVSAEKTNVKRGAWPAHYKERYPGSFLYHFKLTLERQYKLTSRDKVFIYSRVGQCVVVGAIAGSLFSNLALTDATTRAGFLFYVILFNAFSSFAMIPLCYDQKSVYYKHADALFFPTSAFVVSQTVVLFPLQLLETVIFGVIMYWSAGLSSSINGSRFLTFELMLWIFAVACAQLFRLFACVMPNVATAFPMAGVGVILMVLFSGE